MPTAMRLVGPERRQHADRQRRVGGDRRVVFERVGRVVGRADQHHVHLPHDAAARELRAVPASRCTASPDALGRLGTEQPVADAERALQFQVRPVVERIAERLRHGLGPFLELLPVRGVAGAEAFGHAGRAHRPPFVVIAVEPDLREVVEPVILGHLPRRQMAVVVDDRQIAGVAVIQFDGRIVLQQEILGDERVAHRGCLPVVGQIANLPGTLAGWQPAPRIAQGILTQC